MEAVRSSDRFYPPTRPYGVRTGNPHKSALDGTKTKRDQLRVLPIFASHLRTKERRSHLHGGESADSCKRGSYFKRISQKHVKGDRPITSDYLVMIWNGTRADIFRDGDTLDECYKFGNREKHILLLVFIPTMLLQHETTIETTLFYVYI